ncbi:hypothetical protein HYY71_01700 [Candidatus Woesearchaeota archaeon]|nr:hypothetical protein [Candidatus Woesearchaeota archaeon]
MQFINYFFASVISYSGLVIGLMLVKTAPEEQKPLEKYLILLRKTLLLLIFIFMASYYFNYYLSLTALLAFLLFVEHKIADLSRKTALIYIALGILFFLSSKNTNLFAIEASLIMLYGVPTASLIYKKKEKNHYKIIFYNIGFVLVSNLLFLLGYHFSFLTFR